jgi:hypothetical protein
MNKLSKFTDYDIIELLNSSISIKKILEKLGYNTNGSANYKLFKNECEKRNIIIPNYKNNLNVNIKLRYSNEDVFIENSTYSRYHLKKRVIKQNLIEYKCVGCDNIGEWNGKDLVLQLEHINGINNDNRLDNLCFLCPNCHTQTNTYAGKQHKIQKYCNCGNKMHSKSTICLDCLHESQRENDRPEYDQLIGDILIFGYTGTGRKYNVSDNTIRKWKKYYENKLTKKG